MKQKIELNERDIREEAKLVEESVRFWGEQMQKVFDEIDLVEDNPDDPDYEKNMDKLLQQLNSLVIKGSHEELTVSKLEQKLKVFQSEKRRKKKRG